MAYNFSFFIVTQERFHVLITVSARKGMYFRKLGTTLVVDSAFKTQEGATCRLLRAFSDPSVTTLVTPHPHPRQNVGQAVSWAT